MLPRLKRLLFKSYFIALVISIIIILLLPDIFSKYEIRLQEQRKILYKDGRVYYFDLDDDGSSEQIISYYYEGKHALQIFNPDGGIIDQWNFDGIIPDLNGLRMITADYDEDHSQEVYVFYQIVDTVFIDCFEPFDTISPMSLNRKKIYELDHTFAEPDCILREAYCKDIDGDQKGEIILQIVAGRARFPRGIYVYDIDDDSVFRSPVFGINMNNLKIVDLDQDGKYEIIGDNTAGGNIHDSLGVPYSDYSAWIMGFDHHLHLLFEPVEYPGFRSSIQMESFHDTSIIVYYHHEGPLRNYPELMLVNKHGKVLKKRKLPEDDKGLQNLYVYKNEKNYTIWISKKNSGQLVAYDEDFNYLKTLDLELMLAEVKDFDIDGDSEPEQILKSYSEFLIIAKDNFRYFAKYKFEKRIQDVSYQLIHRADLPNLLSMQMSENEYLFVFRKNPLFHFRLLIYLGIYAGIWLFILFIQKLQLIQIEKKNRIRNEIVNLQLKTIKNQINPHFAFNVFNTIASIIKKESSGAYEPFMQFTSLMRYNLESSDKITRSIREELEYLKNYLELEKLRFNEEFDYSIEVGVEVDQETKVPKMLLQTYVENAVKHGLRHLESKGRLEISIRKTKRYYEFEVLDNGIGREKAKDVSKGSTGFGLQIMKNYFKLFNEYNRIKIRQEIIDLYDIQHNAIGTRVIIKIPVKFNYNLNKNE